MPSMNKIRKNLNRVPIKEWKDSALSREIDGFPIAFLTNQAKYTFKPLFDLSTLSGAVDSVEKLANQGDPPADGAWTTYNIDPYSEASAHDLEFGIKPTKKCFSKFTFRNNDTTAMEVRLYEYTKTDDGDETLTNAFADAVNEFYRSTTQGSYITSATSAQYKPHLTNYPTRFESLFSKSWMRKRDVTHVYMPPGSQFTYTVMPGSYRTIKPTEYDAWTGGAPVYIGGMSKVLLIRVNGSLSHESATPANVGLSHGQLDCLQDDSIKVKWYLQEYPDRPDTTSTHSALEDLTTPAQAHQAIDVETT